MSESWIHLFSKFTSEALLFETLFILMVCASYAAFWVLRKRKLGAAGEAVPVGVVKAYLNELIFDAEQLRTQLFGLLGAHAAGQLHSLGHGAPNLAAFGAGMPASMPMAAGGAPDPALLQKIHLLETKIAEQAKSAEAILGEKAKIEKELAVAKSAGPAEGGGGGGDTSALQDKISGLEAKLAEYSIIEDDLANLKRLQQENAQLRSALEGKGGSVNDALATPMTVAAPPAPAEAAPVEAAAPTPAEPAPEPAAEAAFEGLVDQVEASLQPEAAPAAPAPVAEAAPAVAVEAAPDASGGNKSDADLIEEFEKMLNA